MTTTKLGVPWSHRALLLAGGSVVAVWGREVMRANDLAGVVALLVPLALGLLLPDMKTHQGEPAGQHTSRTGTWERALWCLFVLVGLLLLLATRSRGGLLSLTVALIVLAALRVTWTRRRRLLALLGFVTAAALLLEPVTRRWLLLPWLEGVEGLSWNHILTGRPAIWARGWQAVVDFSLTGLPDFGTHVARLYPWPVLPGRDFRPHPPVEDAHNLVLQAILDFGILGALTLLFLTWGALARLVRCRRQAIQLGDLRLRSWTEALLAAAAGHAVYGLFDVLAAGTFGSWVVLGWLILAWTVPLQATGGEPRWWNTRWVLLVAGLLALSVGGWMHFDLERQRLQLQVVDALAQGALPAHFEQLDTRLIESARGHSPWRCRAHWWRGLVARATGDEARTVDAWRRFAACAPESVPLLRASAASSLTLARSVERQQSRVSSYSDDLDVELDLWRAEALSLRGERPAAVSRYRRALRYRPTEARAWLTLAHESRRGDPSAALEAFELACELGDPSANACVGGARLALQLGRVEKADELRKRSRWSNGAESQSW